MEKLAKSKPLFVGLSCLSIGCLIGSFAYPLQKLEIYQQKEKSTFDTTYQRTFILTENDLNYPIGFNKWRAKKVAQIYSDYPIQKILLLVLGASCSISAMMLNDTVEKAEIDSEVSVIKSKGRKELLIEQVKHSLALASKSQRLMFLDEMKTLMEEFGSAEQEILEADELNALYEEASSEIEENEESNWRDDYPEQMDAITWKAILKALQGGLTKEQIVKDVLNSNDTEKGIKYIDYLKGKFM